MSESAATSSPAKRSARRKPASHPKYSEMVRKAMESENGRSGCSRQWIQKYIKKNFTVGDNSDLQTKITLKKMVTNGDLLHIKGIGASGSFALPRVKKDTSKPKVVKPKMPKFKASKQKVSPQKKSPQKKQVRKKPLAKSPKSVAKKDKASKPLKSKTVKKIQQKVTKPKPKPKPKATPKTKPKAKPKSKASKKTPAKRVSKKK